MDYKSDREKLPGDGSPLEQPGSRHEAESAELNDDRNGQFHRSFTPRQVHVCNSLAHADSALTNGHAFRLSRSVRTSEVAYSSEQAALLLVAALET